MSEEKPQTSPLVIAVAIIIVLVAGILKIQQAFAVRKPVMAEIEMRGKTFSVEIANSSAKQELGLGKRDVLPAGHGMYFPFADARRLVFWMKDMRFPIDIIWIQGGKVVDIHKNVPVPAGNAIKDLITYSPVEPADAVFEVNAGVADSIGLQPGDEIHLRGVP